MTETLTKNMSKHPYQINCEMFAKDAYELMQKHDIRHLPVVESGKIVGVVSDRDLKQVMNYKDAARTTVWTLMTRQPYLVSEGEPIANVVREMWESKYGCAIVVDQFNWITGIFTTTDALALLEKLLNEKDPNKRAAFGTIEKYLAFNTTRPAELTA